MSVMATILARSSFKTERMQSNEIQFRHFGACTKTREEVLRSLHAKPDRRIDFV